MDSRKVIRILENAGYLLVRVNGSHHIFEHTDREKIVVVPHPKSDLPIGTLRNIEKQSGISFRKK
ncbi:MAG: type II toxin-antitoxin system HicA family toxin [Candidatus Symbiobacter sp.]|nr:type II toxin-antitoxin system HicA family toxin [Candidatus Symbiobacter sp.]